MRRILDSLSREKAGLDAKVPPLEEKAEEAGGLSRSRPGWKKKVQQWGRGETFSTLLHPTWLHCVRAILLLAATHWFILWLFLNSNAFPSLLLVFATKHHTLATESSTNHQRHQGPKPLQSSCPNDCEDFESNNERSHFPHLMFICCCLLWNSPGDALIIIPTSKGSQWASLAPVTSLFRFLCLKILTWLPVAVWT